LTMRRSRNSQLAQPNKVVMIPLWDVLIPGMGGCRVRRQQDRSIVRCSNPGRPSCHLSHVHGSRRFVGTGRRGLSHARRSLDPVSSTISGQDAGTSDQMGLLWVRPAATGRLFSRCTAPRRSAGSASRGSASARATTFSPANHAAARSSLVIGVGRQEERRKSAPLRLR
jgi:hypothetical protein